ncbi:MAG: ABC transporter permease subunit [Firmicutes bacterium]|nr:ABC transporter permease subunit [Bacillota bacterium]
MKTLIKYEFLKILRKKSTFIVMAVSLLLTAFLFGLPVLQHQTYDENGVIKGSRGIAYDKAQAEELSVPLTEEYIAETIRGYQQLFEDHNNVGFDGSEKFIIGDAYWNFVAPREKLLSMIAANYDEPGENTGYNKLPELDMTDGADFYQTREHKIESILNDPSRKMSDAQKEYWKNISDKINIPLQYGYYGGWEIIISSFELLMFALLCICIVIAPIFSGEYQAKTDAVIMSARYGKTKLITAKIAASFIFAAIAFIVHILVACGIPLTAFGFSGWNLPLQIAGTTIPYPLTFFKAFLINSGVIFLILMAMISLTLFLSAKMKSPYTVLIVLVPIIFIPMFLTPNGTTGIYNLILLLLPYRASMPELSKYISCQFGGMVLNVFAMRAILYAALTAILIPLAWFGFKKHQISA